jgi:hypothetical protein
MKTKIVALLLGVCVLGLLVTACGGESTETAKANFCDSLTDLSSTVMSYQGMSPLTATNDEVDAAADDNALTDAYNDLYYAIQDLPGDNTFAEDLNDLEDELSAFPAAYEETFDGSGCTTA